MYRKGYSRRFMAALLSASLVLSSAPGVYAAEETETAVTEAVVQESTDQSEAAAEGAKQSEAAPQENTEQNTVAAQENTEQNSVAAQENTEQNSVAAQENTEQNSVAAQGSAAASTESTETDPAQTETQANADTQMPEETQPVEAAIAEQSGNLMAGQAEENQITYTVEYYTADGSTLLKTDSKTSTAQSCNFSVYSKAPAKEGYEFLGWSTSPNATAITYGLNKGPSLKATQPTMKLYAVYVATVKDEDVTIHVHLEYMDDTAAKGYRVSDQVIPVTVKCHNKSAHRVSATHQVVYHEIIEALGSQIQDFKVDAGYEIVGMTANAGTNQTVFALDNQSMYSGRKQVDSFYLVAKKISYQVSFDGNGTDVTGVPTAVTSAGNATLTIPTEVPGREGYTFLGWAEQADATKASYKAGSEITLTEKATTLYAVWSLNYSITYYNADGSEELYTATRNSTSGNCSFPVYSKAPAKEGYEFLGWAKHPYANAIDYNLNKGPSLTKDATSMKLYAVYAKTVKDEDITIYVHLEYMDSSLSGGYEVSRAVVPVTVKCHTTYDHKTAGITHQVKYSEVIAALGDFSDFSVKAGYQIVGMTPNAGTNQTIFGLDNTSMQSGRADGGDFYLVAKKVYEVRFDGNSAETANIPEHMSSISTTGSAEFKIAAESVPAREGYTFLGWAESENGEAVYQPGDTVVNTAEQQSRTLYAVWKKNPLPSEITGATAVVKKLGDADFQLELQKTGDGKLTYTVDHPEVLIVSGDGTVTLKQAGTAVITVVMGETENYLASQPLQITVTVQEKETEKQPESEQPKETEKQPESEQPKETEKQPETEKPQESVPKVTADLNLKGTGGAKKISLSWTKIPQASGYDIFGAKCKKGVGYKLIKTVSDTSSVKWTQTGLAKGTSYRYYVKARTMVNGKKTYLKTSKSIHVITNGGKATNIKKVTVSKSDITLEKKKTKKLKIKSVYAKKNKKLLNHTAKYIYSTTNKKVATVSWIRVSSVKSIMR